MEPSYTLKMNKEENVDLQRALELAIQHEMNFLSSICDDGRPMKGYDYIWHATDRTVSRWKILLEKLRGLIDENQ